VDARREVESREGGREGGRKLVSVMMGDVEAGSLEALESSPGDWKVAADGEVWRLDGEALRGPSQAMDRPMLVENMVGVHAVEEGTALKFVAYEEDETRSLCSFLGYNPSLRRREVVLRPGNGVQDSQKRDLVQNWCDYAMERLGRGSELQETKPFLVFINPKSGPGRSCSIWNKIGSKVICEDGGHKSEVIITNAQNHALQEVCEHADLVGTYKGIVIVSGDGLMFEVIQGIMKRPDWARCVRELPVGILPGGSGNGLATTLNNQAGLPNDAVSCAFIVAKMRKEPLDICAVDLGTGPETKRFYSFLSMEWASSGDIDIGSEHLRFLGEARFTIQAIYRLLFVHYYYGRLSFLPVSSFKPLPRTAKGVENKHEIPMYWDTHDGAEESPQLDLLPSSESPIPENWEVHEGEFWEVWNVLIKYMSWQGKMAPESNLGEGFIQMIHMKRKEATFLRRLRYLLAIENGAHVEHDHIHMTPSRAYRLEPIPEMGGSRNGHLAVDGEEFGNVQVQMENMRGFMRVFGLPPNE